MHSALDSLLALETIRKYDPGFAVDIHNPVKAFDEQASDYLEQILNGDDELAKIKSARLLCSRGTQTENGITNFKRIFT